MKGNVERESFSLLRRKIRFLNISVLCIIAAAYTIVVKNGIFFFFLLLFFAFSRHYLSHYTALEAFLAVLQVVRDNHQEVALEAWTIFDH